MSIFQQLGGQQGQQQQPNMQQLLQQIQANPVQMLQQRGFSVPQGMTNPHQMVMHLVQSGQVPQSRLTQVMQMLGRR